MIRRPLAGARGTAPAQLRVQSLKIMKWTVAKELRWEAAHRLVSGYTGKCAHNHGHSYVAQVVVALRPGASLDPAGMIRDFGDFKPLRDWIEAHWDHATLVAEEDASLRAWLEANQQKYYLFPHNPTSEVIARTLFEVASRLLNDERCVVSRVCIRETCTSEATFEGTEAVLNSGPASSTQPDHRLLVH